jgi:hypothetical protein
MSLLDICRTTFVFLIYTITNCDIGNLPLQFAQTFKICHCIPFRFFYSKSGPKCPYLLPPVPPLPLSSQIDPVEVAFRSNDCPDESTSVSRCLGPARGTPR